MPRFPVTDHCDGSRFFTPGAPPPKKFSDVLRWRFSRRVTNWPAHATTPQPAPAAPPAHAPEVIATWINHSTFLLQFAGLTLLTDPVFSERIGILGRIGPRRVHSPGVRFENLPRIDAILLSHDHYDHCDLPSLRRLADAHNPLVIAPLGFRSLLRRAKITRIVELDWWLSHALSDSVMIALTPAQHWCNRLTSPRCGRLWGGFMINTSSRRVFFAGDTGYHPNIFRNIATRLGPPDLSLLPIGAYEPRWFMSDQHINPAEAVLIHRDLGSRLSLGMHWGTFQLTDEARLDPPTALRKSLAENIISHDLFRVMEPGQSLTV